MKKVVFQKSRKWVADKIKSLNRVLLCPTRTWSSTTDKPKCKNVYNKLFIPNVSLTESPKLKQSCNHQVQLSCSRIR